MAAGLDDDVYSAVIPADDRSFLFGDGLFETMLCIDGAVPWFDYHLERMLNGTRRLAIAAPQEQLREGFQRAIPGQGRHILRLTLSRGSGIRGYAPGDGQARLRARLTPLDERLLEPRSDLRLARSSLTLGAQPRLAGIKHCNRLEQVLAAAEAEEQGVDDVLVSDGQGGYQCSGRANLFVLTDDGLATPPCDQRGIAGTRRRLVIEALAPALALKVREAPISDQMLRSAQAVLVSNTVLGVALVDTIDGVACARGPKAEALQRRYLEELGTCVAP